MVDNAKSLVVSAVVAGDWIKRSVAESIGNVRGYVSYTKEPPLKLGCIELLLPLVEWFIWIVFGSSVSLIIVFWL